MPRLTRSPPPHLPRISRLVGRVRQRNGTNEPLGLRSPHRCRPRSPRRYRCPRRWERLCVFRSRRSSRRRRRGPNRRRLLPANRDDWALVGLDRIPVASAERTVSASMSIKSRTITFAAATARGPGHARRRSRASTSRSSSTRRSTSSQSRPGRWNPQQPGEVKMARTKDDDPEAMRKRAEPVILDAVSTEIGRRGLQRATVGSGPDRHLLLAADDEHVRADHGAVPARDNGVGTPAVRTGNTVAEDDEPGIARPRLERQGHRRVARRGTSADQVRRRRQEARGALREAVRDLLRRYPPKS